MIEKNVFTYWETPKNQQIPAYIVHCLYSIQHKCYDDFKVHIITPELADKYLENTGLHENWKRLGSIAQRADCIRIAVINKMGGIWIDADTIFIKSPISIFEHITDFIDFIYMRWNDGRIMNGYFAGKAESAFMKEWLKYVNLGLSEITTLHWTSFGEQILTTLAYKEQFEKSILEIDRRIFLPINIDKIPNIFFEDVDYKYFLKDNTVAVGLNHSYFCDNQNWFVEQPSEKIVKGNMMINQLMRTIA